MRIRINARNRGVAFEDDALVDDGGDHDLVLDFPGEDVRPGLINAHEHLHRNHYGRLGEPPYRSACHWARDIQAQHRSRIAEGRQRPRRAALLVGAWKNLIAGVTTVVHHDAWEPDFEQDFPLRVVPIRSADSLRMTPTLDGLRGIGPFCLHLAEGVDDAAAAEVGRLAAIGLLTPDLIAAHGVGMDAVSISRFRASGAALIWCPTSNLFLFGRTAPPGLLRDGVDVLLGSDSLLTGEGDLLDELRCARALGLVSDARLEAAVGGLAARRLGIAAPSLDRGASADLIVLARPVLQARADDVVLVVAGGVPRVARPELAASLDRLFPGGEVIKIGPVVRWVNHHRAVQSVGKLNP